jgi:death-on-curing protein
MARGMTVKEVSLVAVESVAHALAQKLMEWGEPIPPFDTRYPERLESCLRTPFQKYDGKSLYRGLVGKGAILLYLMIKNHPFQNGNKRVAIMTLLYFLYRNARWIDVPNEELYRFANHVAESMPSVRLKIMVEIRSFIRKNLVRYGR